MPTKLKSDAPAEQPSEPLTLEQRIEDLRTELKAKAADGWETVKSDLFEFMKRRPVLTLLLGAEVADTIYKYIKISYQRLIWSNTVLELELQGDYTKSSSDPLEQLLFPSKNLSFAEILKTLYFAARDKRVRALFIRLDGGFSMGAAQYEELRRSLINFKMYPTRCGKPAKQIIVYADSLGSYGSNALARYYLASAADKIYLPKVGNFVVGPLTIDFPFFKGLLEKLDVSIEVRRRAEFKSALNRFRCDEFDKFHYKQYSDLISCMEYNFIQTIAMARQLRPFPSLTLNAGNKSVLRADAKDGKKQELMQKSDNWSYFGVMEAQQQQQQDAQFKFDLQRSVEWAAAQIVKENDNLKFAPPPEAKDAKEEVLDDSAGTDGLVRCWSDKAGDFNNPQLYLILQFWDAKASKSTFYECVVGYPKLIQTKGKLQNEGMQAPAQLLGASAAEAEEFVLVWSNLLQGFEAKPQGKREKYAIIKKGDVSVPEADRARDEELGLADVVAQMNKGDEILIERNVTEMLHHGSYLPQEALDLGLIDGIKYFGEMYEEVIPTLLGLKKVEVGNVFKKVEKAERSKVRYLYMKRYFERCVKGYTGSGMVGDDWIYSYVKPKSSFDPYKNELSQGLVQKAEKFVDGVMQSFVTEGPVKIAYIKAFGAIMDGESDGDNLGSKTLVRALRACRNRGKGLKGVILHLDSPGGAATACENMYREIEKCRQFGLAVVGIQQNVAASGGYYLSAPCDWVVSSNFTITGSIGIIAGKLRTRGFWKNKLGINYDRVTRDGLNCEQFSQLDGIGEFERIRMEKLLTQWYFGFKSVISEPRHIDMERIEEVARGNVWLGSKAHEFGLVDEIGGIWEAIRKVKELVYINKVKNGKKWDGKIPDIEEIRKHVAGQRVKLVNPLGKPSLLDAILGVTAEHENDFSKPRGVLDIKMNLIKGLKYAVESSCLLSMGAKVFACVTGVNVNSFVSSMMFVNGVGGNAMAAQFGQGVQGLGMQNMQGLRGVAPVMDRFGMIAKEVSLCCGMDAIDKTQHSRGYAAFYQPGMSYLCKELQM